MSQGKFKRSSFTKSVFLKQIRVLSPVLKCLNFIRRAFQPWLHFMVAALMKDLLINDVPPVLKHHKLSPSLNLSRLL